MRPKKTQLQAIRPRIQDPNQIGRERDGDRGWLNAARRADDQVARTDAVRHNRRPRAQHNNELPNAKGVFGVGDVNWNMIGGGITVESAVPFMTTATV